MGAPVDVKESDALEDVPRIIRVKDARTDDTRGAYDLNHEVAEVTEGRYVERANRGDGGTRG
jgi:hypothetical protein